ncbi:MAG: DUF1857 family protein [Burkholderiaceae bacterium]|nr:DUF1857 family protein [Burkholderiaceae bacterium]
MRFEHLVQINDPRIPLLDPLTREQLWRGLVRRAEEPTLFVLALEKATVHAREQLGDAVELVRTLDFGAFTVDDRVRLYPLDRTETRTAATPRWPASRLTIRIEEPEPEALFLRFTYESDEAEADGGLDALAATLRKRAYESADLDTVQRIRELARRGELG